MIEQFAWLVLLFPLASALLITFFFLRQPKVSAQISIGAIVLSFLVSLFLFALLQETKAIELGVTWLSVGTLKVEMGIRLDRLSLLMLLIVTGVGGLIHIYSYGYMRGDPGMPRYFAGLSLFSFSMLGIVLANNFIQLFVFWELVGLSSYLLIGFWYQRPAAADAAKKAFLTNRLGDFGFLLGIIVIWGQLNSVRFDELQAKLSAHPEALGALSSLAGLLIFCGAMGKSAQFPLHVWLPDAMEGPTPVSALIHAATMVAAGVYMLCRVYFIYNVTPAWPAALQWLNGISALDIIAVIGAFTALLAALIATQQNDIKRILAYSTLSQLGYMVMAVGLMAPAVAMFHLATHAFFKALLFLGAGSVIHALHHEQNIWKMGGLSKKMPITFWTFLAGTLALAGAPPLSGFFSKDAILAAAYRAPVLFVVSFAVAFLTAFYMFRLIFVAFLGPARPQVPADLHESPPVMTWPLLILAVPTVVAGFSGLDPFLERHFTPAAAEHPGGIWNTLIAPLNHAPLAALAGLGALLFGGFAAWHLYAGRSADPLAVQAATLSRTLRNRLYLDECYDWLIHRTHEALARTADWVDRWLLAGFIIKGLHGGVELAGRALRLTQSGNLQTYATLSLLGLFLLVYFFLLR